MWAALKDVFRTLWRQRNDQTYCLKRRLPSTATPYHGPVDGLLPDAASPR
jgi:hypothetical protein